MKLLLDTHTFLWWDSEPEKLSRRALELCQNPENTLVLSVASIWEMQIKIPLEEMISQQQKNGIEILPVEASHIFAVESLPNHHKDPFDRLIIAQAIVEDAILISADPLISQYPVGVEW